MWSLWTWLRLYMWLRSGWKKEVQLRTVWLSTFCSHEHGSMPMRNSSPSNPILFFSRALPSHAPVVCDIGCSPPCFLLLLIFLRRFTNSSTAGSSGRAAEVWQRG